jgi:hypothetical protein
MIFFIGRLVLVELVVGTFARCAGGVNKQRQGVSQRPAFAGLVEPEV